MRRAQPRLQRDTGAGRPHLRGRRRVARRAGASRGGGKVLVLQPNRRNASRRNRKRGPVGQVVGSPRLALLVACAVGHRVVARPAGRDEPRCSRDEPRCAEMRRAEMRRDEPRYSRDIAEMRRDHQPTSAVARLAGRAVAAARSAHRAHVRRRRADRGRRGDRRGAARAIVLGGGRA